MKTVIRTEYPAGNRNRLVRRARAIVLHGVLLALVVCCPAISVPGALFGDDVPDEGARVAGTAALRDGFYEVARKQFEVYIRSLEDRTERAGATLLLVEALIGLESYDKAAELLEKRVKWVEDAPLEADYRYWMARLEHETGADEEALAILQDLESDHPGHAILGRAGRLRARCLLATGQPEEALAVFSSFHEQFSDQPEAAENLLDWAAALLQEHKVEEAGTRLHTLVETYAGEPAAQQGRLWLGQLNMDQERWDDARPQLRALAEQADVEPGLRATAFLALAELEEAQTNLVESLEFLLRGLKLTSDPAEQATARVAQGRLLIRTGRTDEGLQLLRNTVVSLSSEEEAGMAQLQFAAMLREQGLLDPALAEYQNYLEAFSETGDTALALEGKGLCLWQLKRYAEAATAFDKAALAATEGGRKAENLFKAADSYFANEQFQVAYDTYEQFAGTFLDHDLAGKARYQAALCLVRKQAFEEAEHALRGLIENGNDSDLAETAALRLARLHEERRNWEDAVREYGEVLSKFPEGARFAEALYHRGKASYRLGQFEEAHKDFERLVETFPESEWAEQADYMRGFARYMLGHSEDAVQIAGAFLEKYPGSRWSPRVLSWLGEYHYNQGAYKEAEAFFLRLSREFPASALAEPALLEAGRSASARKEYLVALEHLKLLAETYPKGKSLPEARFLQGDVLSELGDFASAILVFEEILKQWPDSYLIAPAQGRIGDCHFTLGADEPARYKQALAHYKIVHERPDVSDDLRLQALYKIGKCQEKTGEEDAAFETHMDVVYQTFAAWSKGLPVGTVWFTRAAFSAAALKENQAQWRESIRIYKRVVDAGIPAAEEAERRIQKIRLEHFLLF